jgi:hypothetical protein
MMVTVEAPLRGVARAGFVLALVIAGSILAFSDPFTLLFFETYAAVGAFLALRRPRNAIGWLLIAIAFGFSATTTIPGLDTDALIRGDATTRDTLVTWLNGWGGWASYVGLLAVTIIFPSGQLPEARGRRGAIILLAAGVAVVVLTAVAPTMGVSPDGVTTVYFPNPVAVLPDLPLWSALPIQDGSVLVVVALLVIGVVRMLLRYRHAIGIERLQLRWLVAAIAFVVIGIVAGLASIATFGEAIGGAGWIPVIIAYPTIPLAIGMAVMRYRLFEIDRIISRTIGWALVTGLLVVVFAVVVVGLQTVLAGITQGQTLAVAASTLVAFALFQPVRRRVQSVVDRRFDRARYDAQRTVDAFAEHLRNEVDLTTLRAALVATTADAVRPVNATVWLRGGPEAAR